MSIVKNLSQRIWIGPACVAVLALLAVLLTLDPGESWPQAFEGPGITLDEAFNVQVGVYLAKAIKSYGSLLILEPSSAQEIFSETGYNPDHPPLGRLWLGVFHELALRFLPEPGVRTSVVTLAARTGSAVAFSLTVLLVGIFTGQHYGRCAGCVAAVALVAMPRLFGHAHLAALETILNLTWAAAVLGLAQAWGDRTRLPSLKSAFCCGVLLGLVALTKIQFVVLPPVVIAWALWHWRLQAIRPLVVWGAAGALVFGGGWPWLWLNVPGNLLKFLGTSSFRVSLKCFYFGKVYWDIEVPWHYPWVMFVVTLPLGILLLGALGIGASRRQLVVDPKLSLIALAMLALPLLFSTKVAVYDGERLFLPSFVSWAIFAGIGGSRLLEWLAQQVRRPTLVLAVVLVMSLTGLFSVGPYWLSYYGGQIGGLRGAASLGLEIDYWGQSVSRTMFKKMRARIGENGDFRQIGIAPSLHALHHLEVMRQNRIFDDCNWSLVAFDVTRSSPGIKQVVRFERQADGPTAAELQAAGFAPAITIERQGVLIGALWERLRLPVDTLPSASE